MDLPNQMNLTRKQVGEVTELLHKLSFFVSKDCQEAISIAINCLHDRLQLVKDIEDLPDKHDLSGETKGDFVD